MFRKILVANRGEIASRIMRTARRMGFATVAVYSEADADAPHVDAADEAVCLGPAPVGESYLVVDKVIDAATRSGAGAIHPGYGFLSENADFARACAAAGLVFVGPPADAIELMGNKRAAKKAMLAAGVPCVPGFQADDPSDETLLAEAAKVGFPIMVKAASGGGGRGMRLVRAEAELPDALRAARAEANSAFGSGELIIERALIAPRHVEIQVMADSRGHCVHLGERDCSIQRRHQKVIEESPSPAVDAELRQRMGEAAVEAARSCSYVGAGTVEFLLDGDGNFFFLEMNTRLQVEHPVTELVTGIDLVEWQLRVASGEKLGFGQDDVRIRGHAIEARIYAEDPSRAFMPQTGRVLAWQPSSAVRVDHGVKEGGLVSPHYDPMIAKLIAHGATRDEARRKLVAALRSTTLLGVVNNKDFLADVCEHAVFAEGRATTAFLEKDFGDVAPAPATMLELASAALAVVADDARGVVEDASFIGWRSGGPVWIAVVLDGGDGPVELQVSRAADGFVVVRADDDADEPERVALSLVAQRKGWLRLEHEGVQRDIRHAIVDGAVWLDDGRRVRRYENVTHAPAASADEAGSGRLTAPLDGAITQVFVAAGDAVTRGHLLMVMEAMKMEHRIEADVDGTVEAIHASVGEQVKTRQLLAAIAPVEGGA